MQVLMPLLHLFGGLLESDESDESDESNESDESDPV